MSRLLNYIFAPADSVTSGGPTEIPDGGGTPGSNDKDDVIEFLGEDDEDSLEVDREGTVKPPSSRAPKKKGTGEGGKDAPDGTDDSEDEPEGDGDDGDADDLTDLESELEGPTEEQLELMTPARRKDILKKYPQLFKDFPYLEKAYYREQQFTELLPTIEDAKTAVSKAASWDKFESEVLSGNTETILKAVKAENPQGFAKMVDNYLPMLAKVDEKAYYHVLGNVSKHTILAMLTEARRSNNSVLQSAAQVMNQFVFGSSEFSMPENLAVEQPANPREQEISAREQQFIQRQFQSVQNDLNTRVNNTLKNTIESHIDPKQTMTDYVRKNAVREASETLGQLVDSDARFKALVDRLWEAAYKDNFSPESTSKIKSAFLAKAKALLPSVIKKARNDALRGMGKRPKDDDDASNQGPITSGGPRPQSQRGNRGKSSETAEIPRGMRTIDFLNQD